MACEGIDAETTGRTRRPPTQRTRSSRRPRPRRRGLRLALPRRRRTPRGHHGDSPLRDDPGAPRGDGDLHRGGGGGPRVAPRRTHRPHGRAQLPAGAGAPSVARGAVALAGREPRGVSADGARPRALLAPRRRARAARRRGAAGRAGVAAGRVDEHCRSRHARHAAVRTGTVRAHDPPPPTSAAPASVESLVPQDSTTAVFRMQGSFVASHALMPKGAGRVCGGRRCAWRGCLTLAGYGMLRGDG